MNDLSPIWLALTGVVVATEIYAASHRHKHPGGTLSSFVWRNLVDGHPWRRLLFGVGWGVLTLHLFMHIP